MATLAVRDMGATVAEQKPSQGWANSSQGWDRAFAHGLGNY